MSYDFLTESFPTRVQIGDREYAVRTSFRCILGICSLFKDDLFTDMEKQIISLNLFYEEVPDHWEPAIDEMMKFIRCYADEPENEEESKEETFDFEVDSSSIYSAFFQIYGIDLSKEEMHWFKFISMFENLNDGVPNLVNIMNIRQMKIDPNLPSEKRAELRRLKRRYSLAGKDQEPSFKSSKLAGILMGSTEEN